MTGSYWKRLVIVIRSWAIIRKAIEYYSQDFADR